MAEQQCIKPENKPNAYVATYIVQAARSANKYKNKKEYDGHNTTQGSAKTLLGSALTWLKVICGHSVSLTPAEGQATHETKSDSLEYYIWQQVLHRS